MIDGPSLGQCLLRVDHGSHIYTVQFSVRHPSLLMVGGKLRASTLSSITAYEVRHGDDDDG